MNALVRVNPAQENQVVTAAFLKRVQRQVDPVVDCRQVIQPRGAIGVADTGGLNCYVGKRRD
jgi:hypothetical protein